MDSPLLWIATVACASLAALALLPLASRTRLMAVAAALVLAPVLVLADNWGSERVSELREQPLVLALALLVAGVGLAFVTTVLRRRPGLLAPALIAVLPFRIPIDLGGGSANLLLPLYGAIAAGVMAALLEGQRGAAGAEPPPRNDGLLRWVGPTLGALLVLYALAAGYADDLSAAVRNVSFFLVPFAALYLLIERVEWDGALVRTVVGVLVAEGLLFALVAAGQYATGELFWNDKVISGNEAHTYFRVNSLFWDPNILGRYLAVSLVALAAVVAFGRRRGELIAIGCVFAVLLATLVVTFSQSSTIALLAGILVLAAARWGIAAGVGAGILTALLLAASVALIGGGSVGGDSSGRSGLVDGGLEIAAEQPVIGAGAGSFAAEFEERFGEGEGFAYESHTEPVTVLAEQGAVGFVAYLGLLVVTIGGLLTATAPRLREPARGTPLAAALLAIYATMLVHSLGYAAFLTDPITWVVLALASAGLAPAAVRRPERSTRVSHPVT